MNRGKRTQVHLDRDKMQGAMERCEMDKKELAQLAGVSYSTIALIFAGKSCSPITATHICSILGEGIIDHLGVSA